MKTSDYWLNRYDQIEQVANSKGVRYSKKLEKHFTLAEKEINQKIDAWYRRLAVNNEIPIGEARKLLTANEIKEFHWTVEEYIKYGRENSLNKAWMKELENASAKVHIQRYEALKLECRHQLEVLYDKHQLDLFDDLSDVYKETYYRSIYEAQKGTGVGFSVVKLNDNVINKVINKSWSVSGVNFSEAIWRDKTKLINTLQKELTSMFLTGRKGSDTVKAVSKTMNSSYSNARRLVYTENSYFCNLAKNESFKTLGIDEYEVICTLDGITCDRCGGHDGEHYAVKDMETGVNAPPYHPNCRCTTCPYTGIDIEGAVRATRDGDYNTEFIKDTTYDEWKSKAIKRV